MIQRHCSFFFLLSLALLLTIQNARAQATPNDDHGEVGIDVVRVPDNASADHLGAFLITYVRRDSPAAAAGLKQGDFIVAINHEGVFGKAPEQISGLTGHTGDTVSFTICRNCSNNPDNLLIFDGIKRVSVLPKADNSLPNAGVDEWMALTTKALLEKAAANAWNPSSAEAIQSDEAAQPTPIVTQSPTPAPGKHPKWSSVWSKIGAIANAMNNAPIVGYWTGGKSENNPVYGGYINMDFAFAFSANGEYSETVSLGGSAILTATGSYALTPITVARNPTISHAITFAPVQCAAASQMAESVVSYMALPACRQLVKYADFSFGQLTVEDPDMGSAAAGFGLKRTR